MTRVVVDASVILATLIADGPTRGVLLGAHDFEFYVPEVVVEEVQRHLPLVCKKSGVPHEIVDSLLADILRNVHLIPSEMYARALPEARARCNAAHAAHDEAYVALAETLGAPIWSYDRDFLRVRGVDVVTTTQLRREIDEPTSPDRTEESR